MAALVATSPLTAALPRMNEDDFSRPGPKAADPGADACTQYAVGFWVVPGGRGCTASLRPLTADGVPAPFVVTARSFIDTSAPLDPDAAGVSSLVHFHPYGLGAKPGDCVGSGGINGAGGEIDEELIFTFDEPVRAADMVLGLNKIDFDQDAPVLFVSGADSSGFDFVIPGSEIQAAFAFTGPEVGLLRFADLSSLPDGLLVEAFKVRETAHKIYIHRFERRITCDDGNACTADSCDPELGCRFVDISAACDDGDGCTDDSCDPESGCVHVENVAPCGSESAFCDDCNLNHIRDACDITLGLLSDENNDGLPDECSRFGGGCGAEVPDWSCSANWNLGGVYPNNQGNSRYNVTLDQFDDVFLDLSVSIDSLRLLDHSVLKMTQMGTIGDLQIVTDGGLLNEGTILMAGDRLLDLTCGPVTIRNGTYARDPSAPPGSVNSVLNCETLTVLPGGRVLLDDFMAVNTAYDLIIDGSTAGPCTGDGGKTPPIVSSKRDSHFEVGGNLTIVGSSGFINQSIGTVGVAGHFHNFSTAPDCFDSSIGAVAMRGPGTQYFEVAAQDFGAFDAGFTHPDQHTNYSIGVLQVFANGPGHQVVFRNLFPNMIAAGPCAEALYVHVLVLHAGSVVTLDNVHVYYGSLVDAGGIVNVIGCGSLSQVAVSCLSSVNCSDDNVCTFDHCAGGFCAWSPVGFGNVDGSPGQSPNLDDILCTLAGFSSVQNCPNADLMPGCVGDGMITIDDILAILAAFSGADPCACQS